MPRSSKIVIYLEVDGEKLPMYFTRLEKAMNRVGKSVVKSARSVLKKQGKVVTGNLSKSLFYVIEGSKDTIELTFEGSVPYWDFVEQGVQGANPSKPKPKNGKSKLPYANRAPDSPYKFGSGKKQETSGTLRGGIDRWVIQKPFGPIRDAKGRFIPRKSLVRAVSGNIYNYGLTPSNYYTIALDKGIRKSKSLMGRAIGLDVATFVQDNMTGTYNITISI